MRIILALQLDKDSKKGMPLSYLWMLVTLIEWVIHVGTILKALHILTHLPLQKPDIGIMYSPFMDEKNTWDIK